MAPDPATSDLASQPLHAGDPRLPTVRARLFLLVRSLWKAGVVRVPLTVQPNDAPALRLLHPLWRRLRAEVLGEQLLRDILPAIERHLASEGTLRREESGLTPTAPVDWPATWRRGMGRPTDASLVTRRWARSLDLPENRLALHALHALARDADAPLHDTLAPEEGAPLRRLRDRARRALHRPPWHDFGEQAGVADEATLRAAAQRIAQCLPARPAYGALLAWWQQWQGWHQPASGDRPLLDPDLEAKWLFELLLLFELVAALARHLPVRQSRPLAGNSREPAFVAQTERGPLAIFYQTGTMFSAQRSLDDIWGIPDIVLRLPGNAPSYVILDAKNYGPQAHTQALYKMLGYLYQFGYDATGTHHFERVLAGVLAFPTEEREGTGLRNWQREAPGAQAVMSFVLPPLPDGRFTGLEALTAWLLDQLARLGG